MTMVLRGEIISEPIRTLDRWAQDHESDSFRTKLLLRSTGHALLNDDWVEELLIDNHDAVDKSPIQKEALKRPFGQYNIVGASNERWEGLHQALLPLFGQDSMKDHFQALQRTSEDHLDRFRSNDRIELHDSYFDLTANLICKALFHDIEQTPIEEFMSLRDTVEVWNTSQFRIALDAQLPEFVPTRRKRRIEAKRARLDESLAALVDENDHMDGMIEGMEDLSRQKLLDTLKIIMGAGTGTTASALTFVTYAIVANNMQAALRSELPAEISYSDVTSDGFLDRLIDESLRIYPSIPLILRKSTDGISLGDRQFEADERFLIPIYSMHRNARYWEDPLDYRPSRWEGMRPSQASGYMPFGTGARKCIGQFMSKMNMKVMLTKLFRDHHVELHTDHLDLQRSTTLTPKNDVEVSVTPV